MRKQSGFGLTELMIGMVVGLIIIAGVITVYMSIVKGSSDTLKSAKLNQELSAAMAIMVQDIRRAGYWGTAEPDNLNNPFMVAGTSDLNILDVSNTGDCILYTYDLNSNGSSNNEFFGFKLENGQIMMRTGNGTTTADCTDGTWLTVTDPKVITVNTLTFTTTNSKCLNSSSTASPQANWKIDSATSTSFLISKSRA